MLKLKIDSINDSRFKKLYVTFFFFIKKNGINRIRVGLQKSRTFKINADWKYAIMNLAGRGEKQ